MRCARASRPTAEVQARDRIFVHVAVATVQLQAVVENLELQLGGPRLGAGRLGAGQLTRAESLEATIYVDAGRGDFGGHVRQQKAIRLEAADGLPEGLSLAHVIQSQLQSVLGGGHGRDRDRQALAREVSHQVGETESLLAKPVDRRHRSLIEEQLCGVLRPASHLVELAPLLKPGRAGLDGQQGEPLASVALRSPRGDDHQIRQDAAGDEGL
jgi:hypothetical protein